MTNKLDRRASSAPSRPQHLGDRDELLAGAAVAGAGGFGGFDPLPVAEGDDVDVARPEQPVEPGPAFLARAGADVGGDLVRDLVAVGPVGADRPARAAPRPADAIEAAADHAAVVREAA